MRNWESLIVVLIIFIVLGCQCQSDLLSTNKSTRRTDPETSNPSNTTPISPPTQSGSSTTVTFPPQIGVWRLTETAGHDKLLSTSSGEARKIISAASSANGAIYRSPDGKEFVWADNQFDSPERARTVLNESLSVIRQSKSLRIIYDTPNNGTMFADSQDTAVALSSSGNSVQMFIGKGSENLRSFIAAASATGKP